MQRLRAMLDSSIESNTFARPGRDEPIATEFSCDICLDDLLRIGSAIGSGFGQVGQLWRGDGASPENVVRDATAAADAHGTTRLIGRDLQRFVYRGIAQKALRHRGQ